MTETTQAHIETPALRELMALPWGAWKLEKRNPSDSKATKIPYCPHNGLRAASDDPATWGTYREALEAQRSGEFAGLSVLISLPYFFVDLDNCRDPHTGAIHPAAMEIIGAFNTYTEVSQSGRGVKLIGKSKNFPSTTGKNFRPKPAHPNHPANAIIQWPGGIEIYGVKPRQFCFTGDHLVGTPDEIREAGAALFDLHHRLTPPRTKIAADSRIDATSIDDAQKLKRCLAYVARMPRAVSGSGGHNTTLAVACEAIRFNLSDADAMRVLRDYNSRLDEKWSDGELIHKLESAKDVSRNERGSRLRQEQKNISNNSAKARVYGIYGRGGAYV